MRVVRMPYEYARMLMHAGTFSGRKEEPSLRSRLNLELQGVLLVYNTTRILGPKIMSSGQ